MSLRKLSLIALAILLALPSQSFAGSKESQKTTSRALDMTPTGTIPAAKRGVISADFDGVVNSTINPAVDEILKRNLTAGLEKYRAQVGLGVILDANTGEIRAAVSVSQTKDLGCGITATAARNDCVSQGLYENASAYKLISYAAAIDRKLVDADSLVNIRAGLKVGEFEIHDFLEDRGALTVSEAFARSSNVMSGKLVEMVGLHEQRRMFAALRQLEPIDTGAIKTSTPLYPGDWQSLNSITIGFGHGVVATPLHAVGAVASLVNGGVLVSPTFSKQAEPNAGRPRVVNESTSNTIKFLMKKNVETGTAKMAVIPEYSVGAVTSTTEKIENAHYVPGRLITSFIGVVPAEVPRYVFMTMFDEPESESKNGKQEAAALNAVPVGAQIIRETAPLLHIDRKDDGSAGPRDPSPL